MPPRRGPVATRFAADARKLKSAHPFAGTLVAAGLVIAQQLDGDVDGGERVLRNDLAALNRELRANLAELARIGAAPSDDLESALSP